LTKDPILFSSTSDGAREDAVLGLSSRKINEQAALYPLKVLKRFSKKISVPLDKMIVMVIGVAFKGVPETTDVRGSVAVELLYLLKKTVSKVIGWDAVIENKELEFIGFETVDNFSEGIEQAHVVLILNNHTQNIRSELYSRPTKHRLIFDGWKQLDASEIKNIDGLYYGTMGYIS